MNILVVSLFSNIFIILYFKQNQNVQTINEHHIRNCELFYAVLKILCDMLHCLWQVSNSIFQQKWEIKHKFTWYKVWYRILHTFYYILTFVIVCSAEWAMEWIRGLITKLFFNSTNWILSTSGFIYMGVYQKDYLVEARKTLSV